LGRSIKENDSRTISLHSTLLSHHVVTIFTCTFLQFGGTTTTGIFLGQNPSWAAGAHSTLFVSTGHAPFQNFTPLPHSMAVCDVTRLYRHDLTLQGGRRHARVVGAPAGVVAGVLLAL
jgi:hypothetical protein